MGLKEDVQKLNPQLFEQVRFVLSKNWVEGEVEDLNFGYVRPSVKGQLFYRTGYQQQWLWDSCFHAYINANYFSPWRAKKEIESLFLGSQDRPYVGAVTLWAMPIIQGISEKFVKRYFLSKKSISSLFTQPPFLAFAVRAVYEQSKDKEFLKRLLPKLRDHYNYLSAIRDTYGEFIPRIIHPLESGTDARPDFFIPLRIHLGRKRLAAVRFAFKETFLGMEYVAFGRKEVRLLGMERTWWQRFLELVYARFNFEDPMFATIYVENLRDLAWLHDELNEPELGRLYRERADITENAILYKLWDQKSRFFYGRFGPNNKMAKVKTIGGLVPIMLSGLPEDKAKALVAHLINPQEFWTEYPVPSCAVNEPAFNPNRTLTVQLWRGPTWVNTNWMIVRGLHKHGYTELARELAHKTVKMVQENGLWEYYNPFTGKGYGAQDFGWSTLVLDLLSYI